MDLIYPPKIQIDLALFKNEFNSKTFQNIWEVYDQYSKNSLFPVNQTKSFKTVLQQLDNFKEQIHEILDPRSRYELKSLIDDNYSRIENQITLLKQWRPGHQKLTWKYKTPD